MRTALWQRALSVAAALRRFPVVLRIRLDSKFDTRERYCAASRTVNTPAGRQLSVTTDRKFRLHR